MLLLELLHVVVLVVLVLFLVFLPLHVPSARSVSAITCTSGAFKVLLEVYYYASAPLFAF